MTPNFCNLKCVESIESSPALSLHHNVSPKRLQGIFFPHGEKIKEREEEKRERKGGKNLLTLAGGGGGGLLLKYSFGTHFHFYMVYFIHH